VSAPQDRRTRDFVGAIHRRWGGGRRGALLGWGGGRPAGPGVRPCLGRSRASISAPGGACGSRWRNRPDHAYDRVGESCRSRREHYRDTQKVTVGLGAEAVW